MGQKVNPHGFRVGVINNWDSRWFVKKKDFASALVEDYKIRKVLLKKLKLAGVPKLKLKEIILKFVLTFTVPSPVL